MKIKIRYADSPELKVIEQGEWVDLYTAEDVEMKAGDFRLISLGVAMELPAGYEANIVPRSSTFKNFSIIQTNSFGVIDNSYNSDTDIWKFPALAMRDTTIPKGSRICQFRLNRTMKSEIGDIDFEPVLSLGNTSRGGFGSTGTK